MQKKSIDNPAFVGLKNSEIPQLIDRYGQNVLTQKKRNNLILVIWNVIKEPMFLILIVACALYFILSKPNEALLMLAAMLFVAAISVYQETKSSKALSALKKYTETKINVIRNGTEQMVSSADLVPGDILKLEEGNRVPADAIVLEANDMSMNESILTGESAPVEKDSSFGNNQIFQGTTINSGSCYARITATGNNSMLGKLGKAVSEIQPPKTQLQHQIDRFIKIMAVFGFTAFLIIWWINFLASGNLPQSLLLGLTLAMSAIPEEIPVAFSSYMALGAVKMAKLGIITRQPQTIENLGAVSVICLDKTGTITENRMQVKCIYDYETDNILDADEKGALEQTGVLRLARFASEREPFDAMEKAITEVYKDLDDETAYEKFTMVHEYPLSGTPPMMTHVYISGNTQLIVAKGAPERILRVCKMNDHEREKVKKIMRNLASDGYRIIGVCNAITANSTFQFPENQDDFNWAFKGLVALNDPPKMNVRSVFNRWHQAGIRIKLLTGDFVETAVNIAGKTGIQGQEHFITGDEVMRQGPTELVETVEKTNIYARMFPDAKLKVIEALKKNNEIVVMIGDGVNDGPAIKSAQIGIAMGNKGTELAKESADLIITDDNLEKISDAIEQGRKISANFKKAVRYIISIHIPIILTASLPLILGWKYPNIFRPVHIIFLELIMGPTCSIFYEREPVEANIMQRPPRKQTRNFFSISELSLSILQGLMIVIGMLTIYFYFMQKGFSVEYVRTLVFTTILIANLLLTFVSRSFEETIWKTVHYKNSFVPYVLVFSIVFLLSIHFVAPFQSLFQMTRISGYHFGICVATAILCTGWFEIYKAFQHAAYRRKSYT